MIEQYAKRKINVKILANKGTKEEKEINLNGLRCSCHVEMQSTSIQGAMSLKIWGMTLDQMNSLTVFGPIMQERRYNEIYVHAGNEGETLSLVYAGCIYDAYANLNGSPDVPFIIRAMTSALDQVRVVSGRSHSGGVDAAVILEDLAKEMGKTFENHGVSIILRDRTYTGTALTQAAEVARDAGVNINVDRNKLIIWPRDDFKRDEAVIVSPATGMVGYPAFSGKGIMCTTLYNPNIVCGRKIKVESSLTVANGEWNPVGVYHMLESEIPDGAWFTYVQTFGRGIS